jgi:hypothetical protein
MNMANAWAVLGKDWDSIVRDLSSLPDSASRIQEAEKLLADARKLAKKLMAVHHPDKNPGDLEAAKRFQRVQEALEVVESSTESFKNSYEAMKARAEQRAASDSFIVIK